MSEEKKVEDRIDIELQPIGLGAFTHNLLCWLCKEEPAVYSANPNWCFMPCWDCQKKYQGIWTKKRKWYQSWLKD